MTEAWWALSGAVALATVQLAIVGAVFLWREVQEWRRSRRLKAAVMAMIAKEQQFRASKEADLEPTTVYRAQMSDPAYHPTAVFVRLPPERMN